MVVEEASRTTGSSSTLSLAFNRTHHLNYLLLLPLTDGDTSTERAQNFHMLKWRSTFTLYMQLMTRDGRKRKNGDARS